MQPTDRYTLSELMPILRMSRRQLLYRVHKYKVPAARRGQAYLVDPNELILLSLWDRLPPKDSAST